MQTKYWPYIILLVFLLVIFFPHYEKTIKVITPDDSVYTQTLQEETNNGCNVISSRRAIMQSGSHYVEYLGQMPNYIGVYEVTLECKKLKWGFL